MLYKGVVVERFPLAASRANRKPTCPAQADRVQAATAEGGGQAGPSASSRLRESPLGPAAEGTEQLRHFAGALCAGAGR